jgi:hypothetical protein
MNVQRGTGIIVRTVLLGFTAVTFVAISGCAARKPPQSAHASVERRSYVDLEAGWRIRVVSPVLKSGGFKVQTEEVKSAGDEVQLRTTSDFVGYQVDYYSIAARDGGGVRVRFKSTEMHNVSGKVSRQSRPVVHLFDMPEDVRFVRLLFLLRQSATDHDAVILGAPSLRTLEDLTVSVEANPMQGCALPVHGSCSWIPQGISVQPERRADGSWIPAV